MFGWQIMNSNLAIKDNNYISFSDFKNSYTYNLGGNNSFLKIRSAYDKGRESNSLRYIDFALEFPYIQPNSAYNISWLVFDIDRNFNFCDIADNNLREPNFIVINKLNGHAQVWYRLKNPIWKQCNFKYNKPYKYYMVVYKKIRDKLKADRNFNQNLCKNPFYDLYNRNCTWIRLDIHNYCYTLGELAEHLDLNFFEEKKATEKINVNTSNIDITFSGVDVGLRNSSLFDYVRKLAYKYYYKTSCSDTELYKFCFSVLSEANEKNNVPLLDVEINTIAKSISSWTFENILINQKKEKYTNKQREKSLYIRRKNKQKKISILKKFIKLNPYLSNRKLTELLTEKYGTGFSLDSVNRYLNELKKEKLRKNKSSFASERLVNQFVRGNSNIDSSALSDGVNLFDFVKNFLNLQHQQ